MEGRSITGAVALPSMDDVPPPLLSDDDDDSDDDDYMYFSDTDSDVPSPCSSEVDSEPEWHGPLSSRRRKR